ncbi:MAG: hypothetical protein QM730_12680 [Anaerolineales bacterium]
MKKILLPLFLVLTTLACNLSEGTASASPSPAVGSTPTNIPVTETIPATSVPETFTPEPTLTFTPTPLPTETETSTPTPLPVVESLKAKTTADLLSCRYGPGAEYLYLYALIKGANIKLIGRTDANNWVWVDGKNKCWVNTKFLEVDGDWKMLPVVYPGVYKLPVSPYYPGPSWANATRDGNSVKIDWEAVPISPGKYEDENMHQYIVEVWRCEKGQILFETLGTNFPYITVENDEPGCSIPSHAKVFVQEKHGYGGPVEVPWPQPTPQ